MTNKINRKQAIWLSQFKGMTIENVIVTLESGKTGTYKEPCGEMDFFIAKLIKDGITFKLSQWRGSDTRSILTFELADASMRFRIEKCLAEIGECPV